MKIKGICAPGYRPKAPDSLDDELKMPSIHMNRCRGNTPKNQPINSGHINRPLTLPISVA